MKADVRRSGRVKCVVRCRSCRVATCISGGIVVCLRGPPFLYLLIGISGGFTMKRVRGLSKLLCRLLAPVAVASVALSGTVLHGQDPNVSDTATAALPDAAVAELLAPEVVAEPLGLVDPTEGMSSAVLDGWFAASELRLPETILRAPRKFGAWTLDMGEVGLHIGSLASHAEVGNVVDLNGGRAGSMYQTLNLIPGVPYRIRFLMSGNWRTNPLKSRTLSVLVGLQKFTFTMNKPADWAADRMGWEERIIDFVPQKAIVGLRFSSENPGLPDGPAICQVSVLTKRSQPGPLESIPVPLPPDLADYVVDREAAIVLGKAFFWDQQVGSDGRTACASCHWNAGADIRTVNTLHPGVPGSAFGHQTSTGSALSEAAVEHFRGANLLLAADDFPFHRVQNPTEPASADSNPVTRDRQEVAGSEGVLNRRYTWHSSGASWDEGVDTPDRIFMANEVPVRRVTGRNAPTSVNAVFFDRTFWDGRARRYFNGVNPLGELDSAARVLAANADGSMSPVKILIDNASLASQAAGPPGSDVEMAWSGRSFAELGRKMLSLQPLALQRIASDDSVLGPYRDEDGAGLEEETSGYAALIRRAFQPKWWNGTHLTADGYTHMEANFSLYWGLAVMMYESTLVSDDAPYDRYAKGDHTALTAEAKEGLRIFLNEGKCINCHHGPEFAGATVSSIRGVLSEPDGHGVTLMPMAVGIAFYDEGFYNIGVRPTAEDIGVGATVPGLGPLSYSRREQLGEDIDPLNVVSPDRRVAVDGAFKAPTLRNVELTGPYFHNGSAKSLTEVVQFYTRGADFRKTNIRDLDPDVHGIPHLQGNPEGIAAVVAFLQHLTDGRVRLQKAPFDHPELILVNGHSTTSQPRATDNLLVLPATGAGGGRSLQTFEEALESGLNLFPISNPRPTAPELTTSAVEAAPVEPVAVEPVPEPAAVEAVPAEPAVIGPLDPAAATLNP
ncbi:MAG TPA: hypothetical protein DIT89_11915 [Planctomycetaceae bacterium]|nr:hypothetical protein [Planctomycetaceae bacterium]